ncbi:FMN-binding protein [Feifania hominis]|uniref:FMN-binding protein n=1 Tax=Feifania hominis TaxID=2763660 RepID=A0A926DC19_9FIRM|nr:FMN-binding protein [Feifania hominis]MBC8535092.1 FMN-binding protein [Feifania hominis]
MSEKKPATTWSRIVKPIVVLTVICLLTSFALALTNDLTKDIIDEKQNAAAFAARRELLPEADGFDKVELTMDGVRDVYVATNGVGTVITGVEKGYDGDVPIMVAFDNDGVILRIAVLENGETMGIGKQIEEESYKERFVGLRADSYQPSDVDIISNATFSSNAATGAVAHAAQAFLAVKGGA